MIYSRQGLPAETEVQAGIATESPKRVGLCVAGLEVNSPVAPHHATNKSALYETFEPKEAKRILDRFEFVYTPKHGSWLNIAEIELNVLMGQCLNRRIDNMKTMKEEVKAWESHRNNKKTVINWQFTTQDARIKLKRLYPTILN